MVTALTPPDQRDELLDRIEGLWLEAAAALPEEDVAADSAGDEFGKIRARFEAVSRLQPPSEDGASSARPDSGFGNAFSDLVRSVVRDYIESELTDTIRDSVRSELKAESGGRADPKRGGKRS